MTAQGQTLRTPLAPFRTESTKTGRKYAKLNDGDRVVAVWLPTKEETIYLASADGHVIHFKIDEVNILAGVGKGVIGIKLKEGDSCIGGALMGGISRLLGQIEMFERLVNLTTCKQFLSVAKRELWIAPCVHLHIAESFERRNRQIRRHSLAGWCGWARARNAQV